MICAIVNMLSPSPNAGCKEIGPGVDPHFNVELICEGPIAAVVSRVSLDQFDPERLQGKTAEDIQWLGKIAARHNEIICQAANSSAVLPLRLGTVFQSRDSLQAMLVRCRSTVAKFLEQLGNRQEWGVKLYLEKRRPEPIPGHIGPPPPHYLGPQRGTSPSSDGKKSFADERRAKNMNPSAFRNIWHGLLDPEEGQVGQSPGTTRQCVSNDSMCGTKSDEQRRALLPHPQFAERSDRPHRRNGLQRGFPAAIFIASKLVGDRPEGLSGRPEQGHGVGGERPLATVPFLSQPGVVNGGFHAAVSAGHQPPSRHSERAQTGCRFGGCALESCGRVGLRFHRRTAPSRPTEAPCHRPRCNPSPNLRAAGAIRDCVARRNRDSSHAATIAATNCSTTWIASIKPAKSDCGSRCQVRRKYTPFASSSRPQSPLAYIEERRSHYRRADDNAERDRLIVEQVVERLCGCLSAVAKTAILAVVTPIRLAFLVERDRVAAFRSRVESTCRRGSGVPIRDLRTVAAVQLCVGCHRAFPPEYQWTGARPAGAERPRTRAPPRLLRAWRQSAPQ